MKKIISLFEFVAICFAMFTFSSCSSAPKNKNSATRTLVVASKLVDCSGVGKMKCFVVKDEGTNDWRYLHNSIKDFTYESGYEYVIKVKQDFVKNPAADASSVNYSLIKVVSKTAKDSNPTFK